MKSHVYENSLDQNPTVFLIPDDQDDQDIIITDFEDEMVLITVDQLKLLLLAEPHLVPDELKGERQK